MPIWLTLPILDPSTWVRVDDPNHPDAIARSATGSILAAPPNDGTRWRPESLAVTDVLVPDASGSLGPGIPLPGELGDPVSLTNADLWHAEGFTGAGIRVAVFDVAWFGGQTDTDVVGDDFTTHDCFTSASCEAPFDPLRPHVAGQGGTHGWACAETLHQLAPDAEIHLVRTDSFTLLENAAAWAGREGIDVVSMSMSFYGGSFYDGTGPHADVVNSLVSGGTLLVKSAGNDGMLHWSGVFSDADGDDRADADGSNGIPIYLDKTTNLTLSWNQFNGRCGQTDLDLVVTAPDGDIVGASRARQPPADPDADCTPLDTVTAIVEEPGWYTVEVWWRRGIRVGVDLNLVAKSGLFLEPVTDGSVPDPGVFPLVAAIGAARATTYWEGPAEAFSSRGPTRNRQEKPDLMGPDGLVNTASGAVGFYGTSASAPVVAGLVAVVMSSDPDLTPFEAFAKLQGWAHRPSPTPTSDLDALGPGMARLPDPHPAPVGCGQGRLVGAAPALLLLATAGARRRRVSGGLASRAPRGPTSTSRRS